MCDHIMHPIVDICGYTYTQKFYMIVFGMYRMLSVEISLKGEVWCKSYSLTFKNYWLAGCGYDVFKSEKKVASQIPNIVYSPESLKCDQLNNNFEFCWLRNFLLFYCNRNDVR